MIGAEEPSTVSGSSIHIATISFSVKTSFKILAHIETTVKVLTVGSDGTDVTKPEFVSDMTGSGDIALNGYSGKKRRRQLLEDGSVSEVLELEVAVLPSHLRSLLQDTVTEANCKDPTRAQAASQMGASLGTSTEIVPSMFPMFWNSKEPSWAKITTRPSIYKVTAFGRDSKWTQTLIF